MEAKRVRCKNPRCQKKFVPNPKGRGPKQLYCTQGCGNRHRCWLTKQNHLRQIRIIYPPPGYTGQNSLSDAEIAEIRRRFHHLEETSRALAVEYHVSQSTIMRAAKVQPMGGTIPPKQCGRCGKPFKGRKHQEFCSEQCRHSSNNERYNHRHRGFQRLGPRICAMDNCENVFDGRSNQRYCSRLCRFRGQHARDRLKAAQRIEVIT